MTRTARLLHTDAPSPSGPTPAPAAHATAHTHVHGVRTAAVIAGAGLVLMAALAGFGNLVAVEGLVTPGDPPATAADISASEGMFHAGVVGLYLAALLDVVVAWALMRVFSPVSAELARLVAWLRLAYAFDSLASVVSQDPPSAVSTVTFLGEFLLGVWLLVRGRRITLPTPTS